MEVYKQMKNQNDNSQINEQKDKYLEKRTIVIDGEKYEMKGDYFGCVLCDSWSIHKDEDLRCVNKKCKSNIKK